MWKPVRTATALVALLLALAAAAGSAPFGLSDEDAEAILGSLADRYEVIHTRHGYVLRPHEEAAYKLIEVEEKTVLLDGEALEPATLAERLGTGDAVLLLKLAGAKEAADLLETGVELREDELREEDFPQEAETPPPEEREERRERRPRHHTGNRYAFGSPLTIDKDEVVKDAVVIFGDLEIKGEVRGNVVVLGSVEIDGTVEGNVTAVGGSVSVDKDADVYGDVQAIGGRIHDRKNRIRGRATEVPMAPLGPFFRGWEWERWNPPWLDLAQLLFNTVLLTVVVLLFLAVSRRRITAVADRVRHEPWKAGLVGFVVEVLTLPVLLLVSVVLVVSILGIPLFLVLIPMTVLVGVLLLCMGYAGVALAIGGAFGRREDLRSPFLAVLVGIAVIQVWQVFGESMTLLGGFVGFMAYLMVAAGFLFKYVVWTVGLGAVFLDRFSPARPHPALPPPPLPDLEEG